MERRMAGAVLRVEGMDIVMSRGQVLRVALALVFALCAGGALIAADTVRADGLGGYPIPAGYVAGLPAQMRPVGIPAITPHLKTTDGRQPTFTETDVVQWVRAHPMESALPGSVPASVASVAFITSQVVSAQLLGESTGLPDGALVCYVRVTGKFASYSPVGGPPLIYHDGYILFDAVTGNLIMSNVA